MLGATQSRALKDAHNRDENVKMDSVQNKERPDQNNEKFRSDARVKPCSHLMSPRNAIRGMAM